MIRGYVLRDAFISASNNINQHKKMVDELNVFPVPDGDTGTNMSMTISAAARELKRMENPTASEAANTMASALLRGARGNSGVILSLLFRGFAKGLHGSEEAASEQIVNALELGVEAAYKAVMKPTEGTMLTVARVAAERAKALLASSPSEISLWEEVCRASKQALAQTPEQLPVLKKAGVVDAGGQGLVFIYEGMLSVLRDGEIVAFDSGAAKEAAPIANGMEVDGDIKFAYCTEFIVNKTNDKSALTLRAYLESIGDSVVVVEDEDIIKCHVHTNNPGNALQEALKFGYLSNMKIENMKEQFAARMSESAPKAPTPAVVTDYVAPDPANPYGFVAVAAGPGVQQLFADLGVNSIVSGGQTMNPSTEDILAAIQRTPAETVLVLPNNKNIIMAAEQAAPLADRKVHVLPTKTIPQGLSAMLAFDPDKSVMENKLSMTKAAEKVGTGLVTFAARDSEYDGHKIKQGEILALEGSKLSFIEKDCNKAAFKLIRNLVHKDSSFITVLYGKSVAVEKAEELKEMIASKFSDLDYSVIDGGQPVYHYIISVE